MMKLRDSHFLQSLGNGKHLKCGKQMSQNTKHRSVKNYLNKSFFFFILFWYNKIINRDKLYLVNVRLLAKWTKFASLICLINLT